MEKSSVASSNPPAVSSNAQPEQSRMEDRKPPRRMSKTEQLAAVRGSNPEATRISKEVGVNSKDVEEDAHQQCGDDNWDISEQPPTEVETANIKSDLNELPPDVAQNFSKKNASPKPCWFPNTRRPQSRHKKQLDEELKEKAARDSKPLHENATHVTATSRHLPAKDDDRNNQKEGLKRGNTFHGFLYQLKLLMLFLHRGVSQKYSFRLSTEMKAAKTFDDLVFEYTHGGKKMYRFLQAKHRFYESEKITPQKLFAASGDYSLPKYFLSYRGIKIEEIFKEGWIKDVIICTNINFDMESLNYKKISIVEIKDKDDILDVKCDGKQPKRYKFREDVALLLEPYIGAKCSDDEIKDFFDHLVFAVNQPNEEELGEIVRSEIGKEFDFISTENLYNKFFQTMLNWFQGKERGAFLSYEEGKEFFEEAKRGVSIWFGVRDPVASFVGRSDELRSLHQSLQAERPQTVVVSGLGGVGKTELARKYIKEHSRAYDNKVIWIEAENGQNLAASFRRLACDKLGISAKNASGEEKNICSIVEDVYKFFSNGKSLFIFDNAEKYKSRDEYDHGIDRFLPNLPADSNRPHVLVTSRNQKWPSNMKLLLLDVFNQGEAVEFIQQSLGLEANAQKDDAKQLARTLQCLPLALQQATSYIKVYDDRQKNLGSNFRINDYLKIYKKKADELLNYTFPEDSDNDYSKTVITAWNITLDAIKDKENGSEALEIIYIASYLAPENIPTEMFYNLVNDEIKLGSAVELLKQYSMVNVESPMLNLHRLVQQAIRMQLYEQNREEEVLAKALSIFTVNDVISSNVNHAISVCNYSTEYKTLVQSFAPIAHSISKELINCARYEEASSFGRKISELLNPLTLDNSLILRDLLRAMSNAAFAFRKLGKYDSALKLYQQVYNIQKVTFGDNSTKVLITRKDITSSLAEQGKYTEALECFEEMLYATEVTFPENHQITLSIKHDLASMLSKTGMYDDALAVFQEVHDIRESVFGKHHRDTLNTKNSIAIALADQGKWEEALQMLQEILTLQETILSKTHPDILHTKDNMSRVLLQTGRVSDALKINQELYSVRKDVLSEHHADVLRTRKGIADALQEQCKYQEALEIYREVVDIQKDDLGSDHPDTLNTQYGIAFTLAALGKYDDALRVYHEVLSKWEVVLGKNHPNTLKVGNSIGRLFSEQGEHSKAIRFFLKTFTAQKRVIGRNHPHTLATESNIGMEYYYMKDYDKALNIFQEVYDKLQQLLPSHKFPLTVKNNIALVLATEMKYDEALKTFNEVLDSQSIILGEEHLDTTLTKYSIASVLLQQEKYAEALQTFQEVLMKLTDILGPEHPKTMRVRNIIQSLM